MFTVQNIIISFSDKEQEPTQQNNVANQGMYSIDVQAGDEWVVTGMYHKNSLCALKLKRISPIEAKE